MKGLRKTLVFLTTVFLMVVLTVVPGFAASATQDGITATLTTDKNQYESGEKIRTTVTVTNNNTYAVKDVTLEELLPDGYQLDGETSVSTKNIGSLEAGDSISLDVILTEKDPGVEQETAQDGKQESVTQQAGGTQSAQQEQNTAVAADNAAVSTANTDTGDHSSALLWIIAFVISGGALATVAWVLHKKKKSKAAISVLLCMIMAGSVLANLSTQSVQAAETGRSFTVSQTVMVNDTQLSVDAKISYTVNAQSVDTDDGTTTREEWISYLTDQLGKTALTDVTYSFDDFDQAENPGKIEAAVREGIVDLIPDDDNMVYFHPDAPATREFVAYTAVRALRYDSSSISSPAWTDAQSLSYPVEDAMAVNIGIIMLNQNSFMPDANISDSGVTHAKEIIEGILNAGTIDPNATPEIQYAEGVTQTTLAYTVNKDSKTVTIDNTTDAANWQSGEIHVLMSQDGSAADLAIKVTGVTVQDGKTYISYEQPDMSEVVTSFDMEGQHDTTGSFTPAEGVTVENDVDLSAYSTDDMDYPELGATMDGSVDLFGRKTLSVNVGSGSESGYVKVGLNVKNLEYRFVASPSWHLITIDEAYMALNTSVDLYVDYTHNFESSPSGDKKIKLGDFNIPLGYGFNASGEVYLSYSLDGSIDLYYKMDNKMGVQYANGTGIRPVSEVTSYDPQVYACASAKAGVELEPGAEFLGFDLVSVGADLGLGLYGAYTEVNGNTTPQQFCLDAIAYLYGDIYAKVGPDEFNLKLEKEIWNYTHSPFLKSYHFEETGLVDHCTRGDGDYEGYVVRADDESVPVHKAKVQIFSGNDCKDTTYTDSHGKFTGIDLPAGSYTVRISASGYRPYQQQFDIIGGQTTTLQTQLMISNDLADQTDENTISCSGKITNALTGQGIDHAKVTISSQYYSSTIFGDDNITDAVYTDAEGIYTFHAPIGKYLLTVSKDGFAENTMNVTLLINDQMDKNLSLNPTSDDVIDSDNFRVVLRWGETPRDLDSHLVGPEGDDLFHIFYRNKVAANANLDVDDTTSYGPETVTVLRTEPGVYSYYVHDYTNHWYSESTALSNSDAVVQIFSGNTLKYTIYIPKNNAGTLWHVFDYNSETGLISLVNEFSYEDSPSMVGLRNITLSPLSRTMEPELLQAVPGDKDFVGPLNTDEKESGLGDNTNTDKKETTTKETTTKDTSVEETTSAAELSTKEEKETAGATDKVQNSQPASVEQK